MRWLLALLLLVPATATAAERSYSVGSFERVRIEGPFDVRIVAGASPGARARGDQRLLDRLDIEVNGTTLVVRLGAGGWGETPAGQPSGSITVQLSAPRITSVAVIAGGRVAVDRMKAQRVDLSLSGAGSLAVGQTDSDQLSATLIGAGSLSIGGRAARARLMVNGPGAIDAATLVVNDLDVRLDGPGEIRAAARYTAKVTSTGLGRVSVAGDASCTIRAPAGGPVSCGSKR